MIETIKQELKFLATVGVILGAMYFTAFGVGVLLFR